MSAYISNQQYRNDKSRLTRALNSGDPLKVLDAVEKTLDGWEGLAWPDDWSRWSNAVYDSWYQYEREQEPDDYLPMPETSERFRRCYARFG